MQESSQIDDTEVVEEDKDGFRPPCSRSWHVMRMN